MTVEHAAPPRVSVVIPYFENQRGLDRLLAALALAALRDRRNSRRANPRDAATV